MTTRLTGYALVVLSIVLLSAAIYVGGTRSNIPLVFSPSQVLGATWGIYKLEDLEPSTGRTIDWQRGNITTSEGESYTMLRAVWLDDKATFDQSWMWTKDNLRRPDDRLSAWLFGQRTDGSYGILSGQGGENDASDADTDIAMSLIFAYARWQDKTYLGDARVIVHDLWAEDVITIQGVPYMTADNQEKTSAQPYALIDVSYLSPAAYRMFATIDPGDDWNALIDSSYQLIGASMTQNLNATSSASLPADWIALDKTTGAISAPPAGAGAGVDTNYGYDAMRVPWRLELDYQWYGDARDTQLLSQMSFLSTAWKNGGSLASIYAHDGSVVDSTQDAAVYGGDIGYFMSADPALAKDIYEKKLQYLYDPDSNSWKTELSYYDDNWAWFGIGLYNHLLPNLFAGLPLQLYEL